ncbi:MAG: TfoX/Sxy family protein [Candidatus Omnitrophica bacterium]|nr:TfoX/Sxy family protein [Candidatus Omnitrophota bacterium]
MAYNEPLASRVRHVLARRKGLTEKQMFGGLAFLLHGKMCCGVLQDKLVVRVGPAHYEEALKEPHTRPMDFTGRPLRGFVYVLPRGVQSPAALKGWVDLTLRHAASLPTKRR